MRSVCSGLYYAHSTGFVHCDIKPANILIDEGDRVLLSDFGIARMTDASTATMVGAGTPAYMAPEQIRGQNPTSQTDIYSLGIVLYEMLTGGERPFTGEHATTGSTSERVRWEQLNLKPPSPRKWNPEISPELEAVVLKCLEKDPAKRWPSALALLNALELALGEPVETGMDSSVFEEVQPEEMSPAGIPQVVDGTKKDTLPRKFPAWGWIVIGVIIVGLVLGAYGLGRSEMEVAQATKTSSPSATTLVEQPQVLAATNTMIPTSLPTDTMINTIDGATYRYIPAGEFMMGSDGSGSDESPVHAVYLDAFWIGQTEVTNSQYERCVEAGACSPPSQMAYYDNVSYADHPVVYVDWSAAESYCEWVGGQLPTEAQWEKAARGGLEGKLYPWGDDSPTCTRGAEIGAQFYGCDGQTVPAGSFVPNAYGLYDMAGNVWEWVADWDGSDYYDHSPYENPQGPEAGDYRVLRGGSWYSTTVALRAAYRLSINPDSTFDGLGFRCALSEKP